MRRQLTENFFQDEFDCPCCGKNNISMEIVLLLQEFRKRLGRPVNPSSACRCEKHNHAVGGSGQDHVKGLAVDIPWTPAQRYDMLRIAFEVRIPVIGVKRDCIHLSCGFPSRLFTYDLPPAPKVG